MFDFSSRMSHSLDRLQTIKSIWHFFRCIQSTGAQFFSFDRDNNAKATKQSSVYPSSIQFSGCRRPPPRARGGSSKTTFKNEGGGRGRGRERQMPMPMGQWITFFKNTKVADYFVVLRKERYSSQDSGGKPDQVLDVKLLICFWGFFFVCLFLFKLFLKCIHFF